MGSDTLFCDVNDTHPTPHLSPSWEGSAEPPNFSEEPPQLSEEPLNFSQEALYYFFEAH